MFCTHCRQSLPDKAKFCSNCGRNPRAAMLCDNCKRELPDGETLCMFCGVESGGVKSPAPPQIDRETTAKPSTESRRKISAGRYDQWEATCPKGGETYNAETRLCPACDSKLRAEFSFGYGIPKDWPPQKNTENFDYSSIKFVCESCGLDSEAVACPKHGPPMWGRNVKAKVFMRPPRIQKRLKIIRILAFPIWLVSTTVLYKVAVSSGPANDETGLFVNCGGISFIIYLAIKFIVTGFGFIAPWSYEWVRGNQKINKDDYFQ
jgi:hypothetical protein